MGESRRALFQQFAAKDWTGFRKGLEKEGLRVDRNGFIAQTPHPAELGSTLTHPQITTDYSEALMELITPVCDSTDSLLKSLGDTHRFVQSRLGDEVLWSPSMPCRLDGDPSIRIAEYGSSNSGRLRHVYRRGLAVRYGRMMQSIAGVHYNFSLPDHFWECWQQLLGDSRSLQDFKSDQYFWLIRNFRRRSWLLMLLFGASPALDASFVNGVSHHLSKFSEDTWFGDTATSLRMGDLGYHNNAQASLDICFNELRTYTDTLYRAIHTPWPPYENLGLKDEQGEYKQINTSVLQIENEYYSAIRPKRSTERGEKPIQALKSRGVEYVEVRCLDLDPFEPLGIGAQQIDFLDVFLLDCLLSDSDVIGDAECERLDGSYKDVVGQGRQDDLKICFGGELKPVRDAAMQTLDRLSELASLLDGLNGGERTYSKALEAQREAVANPGLIRSARVLASMQASGEGHLAWGMAQSRRHQASLREDALDAETDAVFARMATDSIAEQKELEDSDRVTFDEYLEAYLRD
ncbi:glutamate--cysteine ligase [Marinobacter nanhaiticus D15-8W]|uniref:Glutamate--cysteine ligase n=1 Tax=Marinobacter nanhaiticus D15-8W TaxID=626887 RepID=N6VWW9_9GAMM|nr:glutamate--cysteine ligase [Marinobacter nanhaiticus]ENO14720.1 glutamate--cysteine ligase [Marinobacter nanhaiticus D15-8W]BES69592.1 glutamate--cysteine ligase [Marinobacter nanhaiticus D15-8W]